MKRIALLHTVYPVYKTFPIKIKMQMPEIEVINVIDDFLIKSIVSNNGITHKELKILYHLISALESYHPDYIISTCSSLSDAFDELAHFFKTPLLKIDTPMLKKALTYGSNITILATAPTTMGPTVHQMNKLSQAAQCNINLSPLCSQEAGKYLFAGEMENFVACMVKEAASVKEKDVIILAQASMAGAKQRLEEVFKVPVLESPSEFIVDLKSILGGDV